MSMVLVLSMVISRSGACVAAALWWIITQPKLLIRDSNDEEMGTCNIAELRLEGAPELDESGIGDRRSLEPSTSSIKSRRMDSMNDVEDEKFKKEGGCPTSPSRLPKYDRPAQQQVVVNTCIKHLCVY